ncbi:hypothetical protein [Paenibacillus sp. YAF4_2]|uniref:hypothetical protein n=1 Tax=Paenibacillus sp. YAF4_2 TaxID=3233085 RepID=UPI003F9AFD85
MQIIPDGCADIIIDMNPASASQGAFVTGLMTSFETINLSSKVDAILDQAVRAGAILADPAQTLSGEVTRNIFSI